MSHVAYARRPRRRSRLPALACLAAVAATGWTILARPHGSEPAAPAPALAQAQPRLPAPKSPAARTDLAWMLDRSPALGAGATAGFARDLPSLAFRAPSPAEAAPARVLAQIETHRVAPPAEPQAEAAAAPQRLAALEPAARPTLVPLPVARPSALRPALAAAPVRTARRALPATRDVFRAAIAEEPTFLERLFGGGRGEGEGRAMAYADPDAVAAPRPRLGAAPSASPSAGVAVYDISAGTVTLPSGTVLEAHSGYGELMDDPRYVHVRMRGPTPPGTYDLTERESLFHGVRAIRLTPVGGSGAIHGRDGILAHTYMLRRQPGASNGCVVFREYDRFLQAFLRGEVRRLIVVAGGRGGRLDVAGR